MSIGERRDRIRFIRRSRVKRVDGGFDVSTSTLADRWAAVEPVRGTESEQAGRLRGATTYLIHVDPRGLAITADDTLVWLTNGNAQMNIREIRTPDVRKAEMVIVAEKGAVISG